MQQGVPTTLFWILWSCNQHCTISSLPMFISQKTAFHAHLRNPLTSSWQAVSFCPRLHKSEIWDKKWWTIIHGQGRGKRLGHLFPQQPTQVLHEANTQNTPANTAPKHPSRNPGLLPVHHRTGRMIPQKIWTTQVVSEILPHSQTLAVDKGYRKVHFCLFEFHSPKLTPE